MTWDRLAARRFHRRLRHRRSRRLRIAVRGSADSRPTPPPHRRPRGPSDRGQAARRHRCRPRRTPSSSSVRTGPSAARPTTALAITVGRNGPGSNALPAASTITASSSSPPPWPPNSSAMWTLCSDCFTSAASAPGGVPSANCSNAARVLVRRGVAGRESVDRLGKRLVVFGQSDRHAPRVARPRSRERVRSTTSSVMTTSSASGTGRNPSASIRRRSSQDQPVVEARRVRAATQPACRTVPMLLELQDLDGFVERSETTCHHDDRIGSGRAACACLRFTEVHEANTISSASVAGLAAEELDGDNDAVAAAGLAVDSVAATTFIRPVSGPAPHQGVAILADRASAKSTGRSGVALDRGRTAERNTQMSTRRTLPT